MLVLEALLLALSVSDEVSLAAELRELLVLVAPLFADVELAELVRLRLPTRLIVSTEVLLVLDDCVLSLVVFAPCLYVPRLADVS
ncbi:MAG: hypothetical protein NVSMB62_18100 [Acidobacteriaceae bacterium]